VPTISRNLEMDNDSHCLFVVFDESGFNGITIIAFIPYGIIGLVLHLYPFKKERARRQ